VVEGMEVEVVEKEEAIRREEMEEAKVEVNKAERASMVNSTTNNSSK
jgi:hypothetical protein